MTWHPSHRADAAVLPLADRRLCAFCRMRPVKRNRNRFCSRTCCNRANAPLIATLLRQPASERFWEKVNKDGPIPTKSHLGPCWVWTASKLPDGYGHFGLGETNDGRKITVLSHRYAFEEENGPIDPGYEIHHQCENRGCVRPSHLESLSIPDHQAITPLSFVNVNGAKTHCPQGHPYDLANTRMNRSGSRECRACQRDRNRRNRERGN